MSTELERSLEFASFALEQMRALGQPATPRNYEIWYTYSAGYNTALNSVINETFSRSSKLTENDLQDIYDTYLSPIRTTERLDEAGTRVIHAVDSVMAIVGETLGAGASFNNVLAGAGQTLKDSTDQVQVRTVVETLVRSTKEMQERNQLLEARLNASVSEINTLHDNLETIRAESLTDPLTGLSNRKSFDRAIVASVDDALRKIQPLSVLMLDIDNFKIFNDTFGHLTGDQVLRLVGASLKSTVKGRDIAARYGGEEFTVVLPNTKLAQASIIAEQIRKAVMLRELKKKSTGEILGRVTVSVGVATLRPTDDMDSLIERADACLYAAKHAGRNCVVMEDSVPNLGRRQHVVA